MQLNADAAVCDRAAVNLEMPSPAEDARLAPDYERTCEVKRACRPVHLQAVPAVLHLDAVDADSGIVRMYAVDLWRSAPIYREPANGHVRPGSDVECSPRSARGEDSAPPDVSFDQKIPIDHDVLVVDATGNPQVVARRTRAHAVLDPTIGVSC